MSHHDPTSAARPEPDALMQQIADYTLATDRITSDEAFDTARLCLMDTLGCGLMALAYPACTKLLGPVVPGATLPGRGARVPGTTHELEPIQAAFNIGAMVRWLDFNDTWLAAEWGHPSDNLGGILAVADYLSRNDAVAVAATPSSQEGARGAPPRLEGTDSSICLPPGDEASPALSATRRRSHTMRDVLIAMIQTHEIQGVLALENGFNRVGLDHVLLVRIASTARAIRSSTQSPTPSSTAARFAPTATRRIPARARAGPRATPPAVPCVWRCSRYAARWVTRARFPPRGGVSRTCSSAANP